jgi:hypothetical protein
MTKNIKLIEQETLFSQFRFYKLNEVKLLLPFSQNMVSDSSNKMNSLRFSRMQPIGASDESVANASKSGVENERESNETLVVLSQ